MFKFLLKFYRDVFLLRYIPTFLGPATLALLFLILSGFFDNFGLSRLFWREGDGLSQLSVGAIVGAFFVLTIFFGYLVTRVKWHTGGTTPWATYVPTRLAGRKPYTAFVIGMIFSWALTFVGILAAWRAYSWTAQHTNGTLLWVGVAVGTTTALALQFSVQGVVHRWQWLQAKVDSLGKFLNRGPWMVVFGVLCIGVTTLYLFSREEPDFPWLPLSLGLMAYVIFLRRQSSGTGPEDLRLHMTVFCTLPALAILFLLPSRNGISASLAICVLLAFITGTQALLVFYMRVRATILLPLLALVVLIAGASRFKVQIKDLRGLYDSSQSRSAADFLGAQTPATRTTAGTGLELRNGHPVHWNDGKWDRKPLVIVCTSGGGIAAAVWSTEVLCQLEKRVPGIQYRIRLVTGASGGMVGAAYFVATLQPNGSASTHMTDGMALTTDQMIERMSADSLSSTALHAVRCDIPRLFDPQTSAHDRGEALQDAWHNNLGGVIDVPLNDLAIGEECGWRPSLVFSPMVLNNGRRLLISNLALGELYTNRAADADESLRVSSIDAVELFDLIPESYAKKFRLSTAARLNAAFPFVSSTPVLPIRERWRVADAGYFDNFGVDLACRWLKDNEVWLSQNVSRVLIIQIRAFPDDDDSTDQSTPLSRSAEELTGPIEGALAARNGSMHFRNDRQLKELTGRDQWPALVPIHTVTIECDATSIPLTWSLTPEESAKMRAALNYPKVIDTMDSVAQWFNQEGLAEEEWLEDKSVARIRKDARIRVGITSDLGTGRFVFQNTAGEYDGIDVALIKGVAKYLASRLGVNQIAVELHPMQWNDLLARTRAGEVDLAISSITFRPDREAKYGVKFSIPYFKTKQGAMFSVETGPEYKNWKYLHVRTHTTAELMASYLKTTIPELSKVEIESADTLQQLFVEAHWGRNHVIIADKTYLDDLPMSGSSASKVAEIKAPGMNYYQETDNYAIAVSKSSPQLLFHINDILETMSSPSTSGKSELQELIEKYQKSSPTTPSSEPAATPPIQEGFRSAR